MYEWQEQVESKYECLPGKKYWIYKSPHGVYYQSYTSPEYWSSYESLGQWAITIRGQWIQVSS